MYYLQYFAVVLLVFTPLSTGIDVNGFFTELMECKSLFIKPSLSGECELCNLMVKLVLADSQLNLKELETYFGEHKQWKIVELYKDTINYILRSNHTISITPADICGMVFGHCGCSMDHPIDWKVDVDLGTKPETRKSDPNKTVKKPLTILHMPDIHLDPKYTPNGNTECDIIIMCCRSDQGKPKSPEKAAGFWGDYRSCDFTWWALEDTLQQVKKAHKDLDYIYFTGDIVDHGIWDTSNEKNTDIIKKVLAKIKSEFPTTPVYPLLGNHEPSPLNAYAPTDITDKSISTNWLFELIAEEWTKWLPAETKQTLLQGGFYTVLVQPGFRVIGINNNVCYNMNPWRLYDPKDQYGQLKWLAETLLQAEKAGEKVHILTHVPPGDKTCEKVWSREYRKIIDRFEATVTAQFHGHTHNDEFEIFYSLNEPSRAINVAYNGGSLTPYWKLNPNYKVFSVDSGTYEILDAETWVYNLEEANLNGNTTSPRWYKLYSYKEDFGMQSLTPAEFNNLAHRMASDKSLLQKYARYFVKDSKASPKCDDDCLKDKLCLLATADSGDPTQCNELIEIFKKIK